MGTKLFFPMVDVAEMYQPTYPWILSASTAGGAAADGGRPDGNDRLEQVHEDEEVDRGNDKISLKTDITATTNNYTITA